MATQDPVEHVSSVSSNSPRCEPWCWHIYIYLPTFVWLIFGVNVGKYSIHGAYGSCFFRYPPKKSSHFRSFTRSFSENCPGRQGAVGGCDWSNVWQEAGGTQSSVGVPTSRMWVCEFGHRTYRNCRMLPFFLTVVHPMFDWISNNSSINWWRSPKNFTETHVRYKVGPPR